MFEIDNMANKILICFGTDPHLLAMETNAKRKEWFPEFTA